MFNSISLCVERGYLVELIPRRLPLFHVMWFMLGFTDSMVIKFKLPSNMSFMESMLSYLLQQRTHVKVTNFNSQLYK